MRAVVMAIGTALVLGGCGGFEVPMQDTFRQVPNTSPPAFVYSAVADVYFPVESALAEERRRIKLSSLVRGNLGCNRFTVDERRPVLTRVTPVGDSYTVHYRGRCLG